MTAKKKGPAEKRGPKSKEINEDFLAKVEELGFQGLLQIDVHRYLGMGSSTWYDKIRIFPEISVRYWRGRAAGVSFASKMLMEWVKRGDRRAIIFYLETRGQYAKTLEIKESGIEEALDRRLNTIDPVEASKIYQRIMSGD